VITGSLKEGVEEISFAGFNLFPNLTSVNPKDAKLIGQDKMCFTTCVNLSTFDLKNAETLGLFAFDGCKKLVNVDLSNIKKIDSNTFRYCESLPETW